MLSPVEASLPRNTIQLAGFMAAVPMLRRAWHDVLFQSARSTTGFSALWVSSRSSFISRDRK
jgi:hypothetical protein